MILTQALAQAALKNPSHPAIIDLGKPLSYSELRKRISQLSYLFQTEVPANENVAIFATNGTPTTLTFFAISNIGNPILFLSPSDSPESIVKDIQALEIKTIFVTNDLLSKTRDIQKNAALSLNIIELEKKKGGEYDSSYMPPPERPLKESDPVLIVRHDRYGEERKYSFFSHKKIYASAISIRRFYRLLPNDRMLTNMNWSHPFALCHGMLLPLFTGATCAVDPQSPSVEEFIDYIAKERITRFAGPPKFYFQLLTYCAAKKYTLPGVKSITVGMGSISLALRKTYKLLKIPVLRCYGCTEAVWSLAMDDIETAIDVEMAKSKLAAGVRCKVLDLSGDEIEGSGVREGPLAIMAESVMDSYFHPDKKMAAAATRNKLRGTWLYTGEIARLEGTGDDLTIAVLGKADEMIHTEKGYLSPRRIDEAAKNISGVADAAGFVQEDREGNRFFACAVVPEGKSLNEANVLKQLKDALPTEFHPVSVHIVENIPLGSFESINRKILQRQFAII